jgi:hypothetical protein
VTDYLVTGIAPTADLAQLDQLLAKSNLENERLSIITKAQANVARAADEHHGGTSLSTSSTIMTGSGGTGVPGVGGGGASLSSLGGGRGDVPDYLGGLPLIPSDQAHNYNIAIAEGRGLVTYKATPQEAPAIETAFREAGLRNVKTFKPKETIPSG